MKSFVRMTKLSNIGGRAEYITNEKKQEAILAKSEAIDWKPYQEFERTNQKTALANNEGRELIIALPNEWSELSSDELHDRANIIAQLAIGKSSDLQWAIHWNHARSNLHIHVIFSERQKENNVGIWDRDIYLTEDGKVARRKVDRAKKTDGTDKPPIHRKGEKKGEFTAKDKTYSTKAWLANAKERLQQAFTERWQVEIQKNDYLYQFHEGKGREAPLIHQKNEVIKAVNSRLQDLSSVGVNIHRSALPPIIANMKSCQLVVPYFKAGQPQLFRFSTPKKAMDFIRQSKAEWVQTITQHRQSKQTPEPHNAIKQIQQPFFSFTAVLKAQRAYYAELFAIKDQRKPLDRSVVDAPEHFRNAVNEFFTAKARERALRGIYEGYKGLKGLLHNSEKKTAWDDYESARQSADRLGEKLAEQLSFSTPYQRNQFISFPLDYDGSPKPEILEKCHSKLTELENRKMLAIENQRPSDALKPSLERLEARRSDFIAELDKIPVEQQKAVLGRLRADLGYMEQRGSIAERMTRAEVEQLVSQKLTLKSQESKEQHRSQGRER